MISVDTTIFFPAFESSAPHHQAARGFLSAHQTNDAFVVCELVLVELYLLLRNPAVVEEPLPSHKAAAICLGMRKNPHWRLVENAPVMSEVWQHAQRRTFARRKIIDTRLAKTLLHHGVTEFATVNTKDFKELGFARVWNPLADG